MLKKFLGVLLAVCGTAIIMFSLTPVASFFVNWPDAPFGGPRFFLALISGVFILLGVGCIFIARKLVKAPHKK
jgi:hypothetical protein